MMRPCCACMQPQSVLCLLVPFDDMHDTDDRLCKIANGVLCRAWVKCKAHPLLPVLLIVICSRSPVTTKITCESETCSAPGDSVIPSRPVCASLAKAPACCTRPWEREGRSILRGAGRQKGCADTLICSLTLVKLPFFSFFQWKDAAVSTDATNMTNISWTVV
jgi:hypothetical protein